MKKTESLFSKYWGISVILAGVLISVASLFSSGLPPTHDGEYHVVRFQQFYKVLESGVLYPRWAPDFNNGFGIPLFNYVYPLPNYVASILHFLGFSFIDSFKLNMILASIVGAIFLYLWAKTYWGKNGGVVASIFYTFSPYHFVDIYVRGSVGEIWGIAMFPVLLWSIKEYSQNQKKRFFVISSISLALLILAHNILALIFFVFFILYCILISFDADNRKKYFISLFLIIFTGFGISSPFWLPALVEIKYVVGLQLFDVARNFSDIYQLIIPSWGYGLSPSDLANPMSVQIGIANIFAFFISIVILFFSKSKKVLIFFMVSFVMVFFLMTSWSSFVWGIVPLFSYFQFPWRFLSLEILVASFLAGSIVSSIRKRRVKAIATTLLIFMAIGLSINYARGATYYQRNDSYYLTRSNFIDGTNSPGNYFNTKWLATIPQKRKDKFEFIEGGSGSIKIGNIQPQSYKLMINAKKDSQVIINTAYFPGWVSLVDGKKKEVSNYNGRMLIKIPRGVHKVELIFSDTSVRIASYAYFFISLLLLIFLGRKSIIGIMRR